MVAGGLPRIGCNDLVLLASIAYSTFDVLCKWGDFHTCSKPIQWQLVLSYLLVIIFRTSHFIGQTYADEGEDFLLNFRHKRAIPRALVYLTWVVTLPLFIVWTCIGTSWLYSNFRETPTCLPAGIQPWFLIFWQVLSYLWIVVHVVFCAIACNFERNIRAEECELHQIVESDSDVADRWGSVSSFSGYGTVPWVKKRGLRAADIKQLPLSTHCGCAGECSICLNDIQDGDSLRMLPGCGHSFHRSCIDLWLLRCADCPLCKREVKLSSAPCREEGRPLHAAAADAAV